MDGNSATTSLATGAALAAMLEDGTFVVAALADDVPEIVEILPNGDAGLAWKAAAISWPLARPAQGARSGFVTVFPLPAQAREAFRTVEMRLNGHSLNLPLTLARGGADGLFKILAEEAGGAFATLVDSLVEVLLSEGVETARTRALVGLVRVAAKRAGVVEVIGATGGEALFIQGWATDLKADRHRVLAACEPPQIADFSCASYARRDVDGRGAGFAGVFEAALPDDGSSLRQLYYRATEGWRALELYERRTTLSTRELPAHIRGLLPQANGPQDVLARLRALANRFDGRETVSQLSEPVRIGVDVALRAEGGGLLVAGWLLDPKRRVQAVRVCAGGEAVAIDGDWSRMARPDVTNAFANDPLFQGLPLARAPSGFIAFAPRVGGEDAYIEIDLGAGEPSYFPLTVSTDAPRKTLARLIASVDLRSSAALHAAERQFGPMLRASEGETRGEAKTETFGPENAFKESSVALVIGADERVGEAASLLALLATDPASRALPIILAAPGDASEAVAGEVARLADFYGLALRLVQTRGGDAFDSMVAGAAVSDAETLVLLSADVLPTTRGWISKLLDVYRQTWARFAVSPTILFEDGSVRWAGAWLEEGRERNRLMMPYVGFPANQVADERTQEVAAATLECCALPRTAFKAIACGSGGYLGSAARNLDIALCLRTAGTHTFWAPEITMIAASEIAPTQGLQMAQRIDRWTLEHRWALPIANLSR